MLAIELQDLWDGRIGFAEFARRSDRPLRGVAAIVRKKYRLESVSVSEEDVLQDLLEGIWQACSHEPIPDSTDARGRRVRSVSPWDPSREVSLERYVMWQAVDKARKRLRSHWRLNHREEVRFEEDDEQRTDSAQSYDRIAFTSGLFHQTDEADRTDVSRALIRIDGWEETCAGMIAAGMTIREAAGEITSRQDLRERLGATTLRHAAARVKEAVQHLQMEIKR